MENIYLLVEHGRDQGEAYVLGWFDDERRAKETANEMEWKAYRAELNRAHQWSNQQPLSPDQSDYRRFWVKEIAKLHNTSVPKSSAVH
ncbi:hypothetical protein QN399_22075 [Pseudomonas sp. 10C3]|uniref:hypothetical protein n=1 Tax=Pseudomonas sp. 10C3 TaxID=3118753 RepID=UPI002E7FC791|nr:hypothetical protein [Pseudomonas sp. 10C3]MEE3508905.1 hypothetical protein [Pseudomonas sp. 10C3]